MIRDAGFRNVRLPVDVKFMVNWKKPSKLKSDAVKALDAAVEMLTRNGLAVIVSPFGNYNDKITTADGVSDVLAFAHSWAKHLSRFDPDDVILQTANEPLGDTTSWLPVQWQIATVMRQAAPRHTLLTSATLRYSPDPSHNGSLDALVAGGPLPDPNVIYGFHYYDPYIFTAQGLEWAWPGYGSLRYVPYPSNPENVQWLIDTLDGEIVEENRRDVLNTLRQYGLEEWNAETIKADLMRVRQWADRYGVPVVADEFGTVSDSPIDPGDRATWIKDVRATLQKLDIGWTMWDYAGDYELAIEDAQGNRTFRQEVLDALGLG